MRRRVTKSASGGEEWFGVVRDEKWDEYTKREWRGEKWFGAGSGSGREVVGNEGS